MDLITEAINILPADVLIKIMLTLPGPSVLALCITNKNVNNFCTKYENKLFMQLVYRDFEPYIQSKQDTRWKYFYLKKLTQLGQPYILDLTFLPNFCETTIGNIADLPENYWNNPKSKIRFNLGPYIQGDIGERKTVLSDYSKGKKYWIVVGLNKNQGNNIATIHNTFSSAFQRSLVFFKIIQKQIDQNKDQIFFENNIDLNDLIGSLRSIYKDKGYICYYPKPGIINKIIIKQITLF